MNLPTTLVVPPSTNGDLGHAAEEVGTRSLRRHLGAQARILQELGEAAAAGNVYRAIVLGGHLTHVTHAIEQLSIRERVLS